MSLCELRIIGALDVAVKDSISKSGIDFAGLLDMAATHNAAQLEKWLLFFLSSNYLPCSHVLPLLSDKHRKHCEKNRWPPEKYVVEMKKWKDEKAEWNRRYGKGKIRGSQDQHAFPGCSVM